MELDDFLLRDGEEGAVEREVAEKIAFAMFHGDNEVRRINALERFRESAAVPDEIADAVGTDGPGAENEPLFPLLEGGD